VFKKLFRLSDSKPNARQDVDDELGFHLEMKTREFMEQGMSPADARRKAEASFGDVQGIRRDLRAERGARNVERERRDWWEGLAMDVRYAMRALRKQPVFASAAIATIALGIGCTMAVYTVVNGVLVRPLPYKDPEHLAMIWISQPNRDGGATDLPLTSGFFQDLQRDARTFDGMAAFRSWPYSLDPVGGSEAEPVAGARVSPALFPVLGVRPYLGQTFDSTHALPNGPVVVVISHALWQRRYGSDPNIVGRQIGMGGTQFTVLGVMPPGFSFPRGAELPSPFQFGLRTDVWTPMRFDPTAARNYSTMNLSAVGRWPASGSLANAEADANGIIKRFLEANAPQWKLGYHLVPLADQAAGKVKGTLLMLMGAVSLLLLIAITNVASLLAARGAQRQRELAVRAALGAGHGRIARQLVTENLVLAAAGGTLGVALSLWGTRAILALVPGSMPRADDIGLDWRVTLVAVAMAVAAGAVFGLVSASAVRWNRLATTLHDGGTRATDRAGRAGRQLMVSLEVAVSVVLLIGAALLTRSFIQLQQVPPGFQSTNVLTMGIGLPVVGRFDPAAQGPDWMQTFNRATATLATMPGIAAAGATSLLPLSGAWESGGFRIPSRPAPPDGQQLSARYSVLSGDYFKTLQIRVLAGRSFDASDDVAGALSIIVNNEFARRYFGSPAEAIGKIVIPSYTFVRDRQHIIVGVVDDVKQGSLDDTPSPQQYVPISQMPYPGLTLTLRTNGDPLVAIPAVRKALREVDPRISVKDIRTMDDVMANSLARQRFSMTLIGVFAGAALLLALVGLYGVIALIAGQRRREMGVRLALGAQPGDVVRLVLSQGVRLAGVGVALGLVGAVGLTRVMQAMLFEVSTTDTATFAGAAIVVLLVSLAATLAPARSASRVDPTLTLRSE
jgi:putative ABC transport system permease protein